MEYNHILGLIFYFTMVTAGVYLLLRLSLLISFSYYTILFITIIGSLTTFIGGLLALTSLDMKELIAYSTMSQLGYRYYSKNSNSDNNNKFPKKFIKVFNYTEESKYIIKSTYRNVPIIYAFYNLKNNKFYVGKTRNPWFRFGNYFNKTYLNNNYKKNANL